MINKLNIPEKIEKILFAASEEADASRDYKFAIKIYEKYNRRFIFSNEIKYKFGVLLDHAAMSMSQKGGSAISIRKFLKKAEGQYGDILKKDKRNILAYRGLSRVYELRKNWKAAEKNLIKAYNLWRKVPKEDKGPLGIGGFYEERGDIKEAERWYKIELKELGKEDLAAMFNLFMFYKRSGNLKKANLFKPKLEIAILKIFGDRENLFAISKKNKTVQFIARESGLIK